MQKHHLIHTLNSAILLIVFATLGFSCKRGCYVCRLEQINGPESPSFPNDTIYIDTSETCSWRWVKENNVPPGEYYFQSWRCEPAGAQ